MRILEKKAPKYSGWRRRLMATYAVVLILSVVLSAERTAIDVLGEMWSSMLLNSAATICAIAGLLGICAAEKIVFALYAIWSVLALLMNLAIVFIYNEVGLLREMEKYLGGGDNFWKAHGVLCGAGEDVEGVDGDSSGSGQSGEVQTDSCLVYYAIIETIQASIFMALLVVGFVQSTVLLLSREAQPKYVVYEESDDEDFSYVNLAITHEHDRRENHSNRHSMVI